MSKKQKIMDTLVIAVCSIFGIIVLGLMIAGTIDSCQKRAQHAKEKAVYAGEAYVTHQ